MNDYSDKGFPWNFYFNGELMPKWGACWGMAGIGDFLQPEKDACDDISDRDVYITYCKIDHVGVVESADPDVFLYAIQQVIYLLLHNQDTVRADIAKHYSSYSPPEDIFNGILDAAFRMRELVIEQSCAFWTSGYEEDCKALMHVMQSSKLPVDSPAYLPPPHIARVRAFIQNRHKDQVVMLHKLAQSGHFAKDLRKRLHEIRAV
jgi:hypothetical protein